MKYLLFVVIFFVFSQSATASVVDSSDFDLASIEPANIDIANIDVASIDFPSVEFRKQIAERLLNDMASVDAVTMKLRDKTRKVSWADFRKGSAEQVEKAQDWEALYSALNNIHYGIINRHSFLLVGDSISDRFEKLGRWPGADLGYTWPEINFFTKDQHQDVAQINGVPTSELFEQFYNWYCNDVHVSGCLSLFTRYLRHGYGFLGKLDELTVTLSDGTRRVYQPDSTPKIPERDKSSCESVYQHFSLFKNNHAALLFSGSQACLFEIQDKFVVKIFYFGSWGTDYGDIYCIRAEDEGMCHDINRIKSILNENEPKVLVLDIQDNGGGSEGTPWIAALTHHGFYDNLAKYRNIPLLKDPVLRENAFYYSDKAENWYQGIEGSVSESDYYLPPRAEFCRGSERCQSTLIKSAKYPFKYSELRLVINNQCVSSCDDMVWRTRRFADAKTFGQLPASDGVYARLNGYVFLNKQHQVDSIIVGEDTEFDRELGRLLVSWRLPISKTVAIDGKDLEGDDSVLDVAVAVTKSNFATLNEHNLLRAINH